MSNNNSKNNNTVGRMDILSFPSEILVLILSRVDILSLTLHVPLVCRRFNTIIKKSKDASTNTTDPLRASLRRGFISELDKSLHDNARLYPLTHPVFDVLQLRKRRYNKFTRPKISDIGVFLQPWGIFVPLKNTVFANDNATSPAHHVVKLDFGNNGEEVMIYTGYTETPWALSVIDIVEEILDPVWEELEKHTPPSTEEKQVFGFLPELIDMNDFEFRLTIESVGVLENIDVEGVGRTKVCNVALQVQIERVVGGSIIHDLSGGLSEMNL